MESESFSPGRLGCLFSIGLARLFVATLANFFGVGLGIILSQTYGPGVGLFWGGIVTCLLHKCLRGLIRWSENF